MLSKEDARELVRRLRATDGKGQGGPLKKAAADYIEELEAKVGEMQSVIATWPDEILKVRDHTVAQERERCARVAEKAASCEVMGQPVMAGDLVTRKAVARGIAAKIREG